MPSNHPQPAFSRASHFAAVLAPVVLGVGYALIRDCNGSFWGPAMTFFMLLFGLGGGILLLHAIDKIDDWEENHKSK